MAQWCSKLSDAPLPQQVVISNTATDEICETQTFFPGQPFAINFTATHCDGQVKMILQADMTLSLGISRSRCRRRLNFLENGTLNDGVKISYARLRL